MYEHVVEHLPQAQHSTAQHSAFRPAQSGKASTCRSESDNASTQTELARASMFSSIRTARSVFKTNEEIEICPAYQSIQHLTNQLSRGDARRTCLYFQSHSSVRYRGQTLLFLSVLFLCISLISYMHAASGLFSWSMELLAFASRQFAPKMVDLSVRFIRILFYSSS